MDQSADAMVDRDATAAEFPEPLGETVTHCPQFQAPLPQCDGSSNTVRQNAASGACMQRESSELHMLTLHCSGLEE